MASLKSKTLFFVTSPRTPFKMIPEIKLLVEEFSGKPWNNATQEKFAKTLSERDFFEGEAINDSAFSARDRINRAPKAFGFVDIKPTIQLTEPGRQLIYGRRAYEIFTRQLLKFQLPSPYHTDNKKVFFVKPYLEILRLIYELEYITKDEIKIFGIQMTDYRKYENIKNQIIAFRKEIKKLDRDVTSYRGFMQSIFIKETNEIYNEEIIEGLTKTRESNNKSADYFIGTKMNNARDYADACFRYLRATELVVVSKSGTSLKISENKVADVEYIINNTDRNPVNFTSEAKYKEYLFDPTTPVLITDNKASITKIIKQYGITEKSYKNLELEELKDFRDKLIGNKRKENIEKEASELRTYRQYQDIVDLFGKLTGKRPPVDSPLLLEWNVWRAFAMLNDGKIEGNFKVDDEGMPLSTAIGNMADIECRYKNFNSIIEVTLSTGQRQYEMEGEPVARHLAQFKRDNPNDDSFCIFVAKTINEAALAHFYTLHKVPIGYYGGISKIIPIDIGTLVNMITVANRSYKKPKSSALYNFLKTSSELASKAKDELDWYNEIKRLANEWISIN